MVFIFIFLLDSSAFPWVPPPSTLQHANKVKSSPHLTPIFQKIKKKGQCPPLNTPRYRGDKGGAGRGQRQNDTGKEEEGRQVKRGDGREERAWGLGQGGGMISVNLHLVCYRWYRPPRTVICLGFPKQRWTGTPAYTGLFCLQLLESLLSVYYHRSPWV